MLTETAVSFFLPAAIADISTGQVILRVVDVVFVGEGGIFFVRPLDDLVAQSQIQRILI